MSAESVQEDFEPSLLEEFESDVAEVEELAEQLGRAAIIVLSNEEGSDMEESYIPKEAERLELSPVDKIKFPLGEPIISTVEDFVNFRVQDINKVVPKNERRHRRLKKYDPGDKRTWHNWGTYKVLTKDQEAGLFQILEKGRRATYLKLCGIDEPDFDEAIRKAQEARDHIFHANMRLGVHYSFRFAMGDNEEDVQDIQVSAMAGISRAIDKFEWREGNKFSTYCMWWIKQSVSRYLDNFSSTIRVPVHERQKMKDALRSVNNDPDLLSVEERQIYDMANTISLNKKSLSDEDSSTEIGDWIVSPDSNQGYDFVDNMDQIEYLREIVNVIAEKLIDTKASRQVAMFKYRFGLADVVTDENGLYVQTVDTDKVIEQRTINETAEAIGVNRATVTNAINRVLGEIRMELLLKPIIDKCGLGPSESRDLRCTTLLTDCSGRNRAKGPKNKEVLRHLPTVYGEDIMIRIIEKIAKNGLEERWLSSFLGLTDEIKISGKNATNLKLSLPRAKKMQMEAISILSQIS